MALGSSDKLEGQEQRRPAAPKARRLSSKRPDPAIDVEAEEEPEAAASSQGKAGPQSSRGIAAKGKFPVVCSLTQQKSGLWVLEGKCKLCEKTFLASGTATARFKHHSQRQHDMVAHAKEAHSLQGSWSFRRDLTAKDRWKRLLWKRSQETGDKKAAEAQVDESKATRLSGVRKRRASDAIGQNPPLSDEAEKDSCAEGDGGAESQAPPPPEGTEDAEEEVEAEFPVACCLTKHEHGFWVLKGKCRICNMSFHQQGRVRQKQILSHVREAHDLEGQWFPHKRLGAHDPWKRLIWTTNKKGPMPHTKRIRVFRSGGMHSQAPSQPGGPSDADELTSEVKMHAEQPDGVEELKAGEATSQLGAAGDADELEAEVKPEQAGPGDADELEAEPKSQQGGPGDADESKSELPSQPERPESKSELAAQPEGPDGAAPGAPQGEAGAAFPVSCCLTQHETGIWVLRGECRICHKLFEAKGNVCPDGTLLRFNSHALRQREMLSHARELHELKGEWFSFRNVDAEDPWKRLVWTTDAEEAKAATERHMAYARSCARRHSASKASAETDVEDAAAKASAEADVEDAAADAATDVATDAEDLAPVEPRSKRARTDSGDERSGGSSGCSPGAAAEDIPAEVEGQPGGEDIKDMDETNIEETKDFTEKMEVDSDAMDMDPSPEFPIACSMTLHEEGFWVLDGECRLCGQKFAAPGCAAQAPGPLTRFNGHAARQREMAEHARHAHGLHGKWAARYRLDAEDPSKRLIWTTERRVSWRASILSQVGPQPSQEPPPENTQTQQEPAPVPEEEEGPPELTVSEKVGGSRPTIVLPAEGPKPPRALLPKDALLRRAKARNLAPLKAEVFPETLAEASAAGIEAPLPWPGLGVVPEELRGGFRSLLVVGPSGSGKTTLLRQLLSEQFPEYDGSLYPSGEWTVGQPLIEAFDTAEEGRDLLNGVGLCSVPSWCKPYSVLSVGERYRANVALALQRRRKAPQLPLVFDEWTSELDRMLARNVSLALGKRLRRESEAAQQNQGPYIFATCHDDVVTYLQPELICYCYPGEASRVVRNPHAGAAPNLRAVLRGQPLPSLVQSKDDLIIGNWAVDGTDMSFSIRPKFKSTAYVFWLYKDAGSRVANLCLAETQSDEEKAADMSFPGPVYSGPCARSGEHYEMRLLSQNTMQVVHCSGSGAAACRTEGLAVRLAVPMSWHATMMARDPSTFKGSPNPIDYKDCEVGNLEGMGWYLPPELGRDELYSGLERSCEPLQVLPTHFYLNPQFEEVEEKPYYLAAYVGKADGSLSSKLRQVSRLLDCPFDGLCVHKVPKLPDLGRFSMGLVTGPSGSGKTSLARTLFSPSPEIEWSDEAPVLAHFSSLASAREFCGAVCLDLGVAMRPFGILSAGEQARARTARLLDAAVREKSKGKPRACFDPLLLEEFTSLVDRPLAKRMARSVNRLAVARRLRLVAVSCHRDFARGGGMQPEWLFERHSGRLLRFRTPASKLDQADSEWTKRIEEAQAAVHVAKFKLLRLEKQVADTFFSEEFRVGFAKALESLGPRELEMKQDAIANLEKQRSEALAPLQAEIEAAVAAQDEEEGARKPARAEAAAGASVLGVPTIELEVRRALLREWVNFREHHYKDHKLKGDSVAFVGLIDGHAACFTAIAQEAKQFVFEAAVAGRLPGHIYPGDWLNPKRPRYLYREHRTVVLPDFQGMGLAPLLCDTVGAYINSLGHDFTSQTIHPYYGSYRGRSPFWRPMHTNRTQQSAINGNLKYSHFFVGAALPEGGEDPELRRRLSERAVLELAQEPTERQPVPQMPLPPEMEPEERSAGTEAEQHGEAQRAADDGTAAFARERPLEAEPRSAGEPEPADSAELRSSPTEAEEPQDQRPAEGLADRALATDGSAPGTQTAASSEERPLEAEPRSAGELEPVVLAALQSPATEVEGPQGQPPANGLADPAPATAGSRRLRAEEASSAPQVATSSGERPLGAEPRSAVGLEPAVPAELQSSAMEVEEPQGQLEQQRPDEAPGAQTAASSGERPRGAEPCSAGEPLSAGPAELHLPAREVEEPQDQRPAGGLADSALAAGSSEPEQCLGAEEAPGAQVAPASQERPSGAAGEPEHAGPAGEQVSAMAAEDSSVPAAEPELAAEPGPVLPAQEPQDCRARRDPPLLQRAALALTRALTGARGRAASAQELPPAAEPLGPAEPRRSTPPAEEQPAGMEPEEPQEEQPPEAEPSSAARRELSAFAPECSPGTEAEEPEG